MPAPAPAGSPRGGIRLFRLFQIDVYLHWLWIVVAVYEINTRSRDYSSIAWNVAEYLALFLIVLLHEFGHALAGADGGAPADALRGPADVAGPEPLRLRALRDRRGPARLQPAAHLSAGWRADPEGPPVVRDRTLPEPHGRERHRAGGSGGGHGGRALQAGSLVHRPRRVRSHVVVERAAPGPAHRAAAGAAAARRGRLPRVRHRPPRRPDLEM